MRKNFPESRNEIIKKINIFIYVWLFEFKCCGIIFAMLLRRNIMKKLFLLIIVSFFCIQIGFGEILLETHIDMQRLDEYVLKAIFTYDNTNLTYESFFVKSIPSEPDYNIIRQSFSEKIFKNNTSVMIKRTFSFYIRPLREGKINIKSIEFVNSKKDKKFLTVPKMITVRNYTKFKRYGKVLLLVVLFFLICFLVYIWVNRKKEKEPEVIEEEIEISSIDEIIRRIEKLFDAGQHKEVFTELYIASDICSNQEYKAKINLLINDHGSLIKFGGEKLNDQIKSEIMGVLHQMSREENLEHNSKCPSCGHIVSDNDQECSSCGVEFE